MKSCGRVFGQSKLLRGVAIALLSVAGFSALGLTVPARHYNQELDRARQNGLELSDKISTLNEKLHLERQERWEQEERKKLEQEKRVYLENYTQADRERAIEAVYAEARGQPDQMYDVVITIGTRALESGESLSETIDKDRQYSYLNSGDTNEVKAGNAREVASRNSAESRAYQRCAQAVDKVLKEGIALNKLLTHYFVRSEDTPLTPGPCPEFAFEEVDGKVVPRVPEKTYRHVGKDGKGNPISYITRFYYLTEFEANARGHVFTSRVN